jgi:predicted DNA-binding transcriptional regulator AlpA
MHDASSIAPLTGNQAHSSGAFSPPRLLTEKQVAEILSTTTRTLQRWRTTCEGPAWSRLGSRLVRYSAADIEGWRTGRTFRHRAQEMAGGR